MFVEERRFFSVVVVALAVRAVWCCGELYTTLLLTLMMYSLPTM